VRRQRKLQWLTAKPGYVLLAVENIGSRLDRDIAHRTFEPLFSTKSEGTGIGPSIIW
jgi:signal transduction histidine kinase